jgi:hypothetical protein
MLGENNVFFQYIGLIIFLLIIIYIFYFIFNGQLEGMRNRSTKREGMSNNNDTSHATNAEKYTEKIKYLKNTMKDNLNIPKYRSDYENILIEMSDYIDSSMLDELLTIDPTSDITSTSIMKKLDNINKLSTGRNNLNTIMKYLDKN